MITCLRCSTPLILNIDAKQNDFKCKECSEKYSLVFDKKILKISNKKKQISFYISDLSNCDKEFSLKNVYDMYNKGYLDCIKTLNSKYNQSESFWHLSVNKLKDKISQNINFKLNNILNSNDENYMCSKCMSQYSSDDALKNSYSCMLCSNQLNVIDKSEEIDALKKNLIVLDNNWSTLF